MPHIDGLSIAATCKSHIPPDFTCTAPGNTVLVCHTATGSSGGAGQAQLHEPTTCAACPASNHCSMHPKHILPEPMSRVRMPKLPPLLPAAQALMLKLGMHQRRLRTC